MKSIRRGRNEEQPQLDLFGQMCCSESQESITQKYSFIDLFAGCGGLSEGFMKSGNFTALAHVEWEDPMVCTLRNRLEKKWGETKESALEKVICFDIQRTDELLNGNWSAESVEKYGGKNSLNAQNGLKKIIGKRKVDLIIGGPPCQAYSIHGRATDKNSMKDDYRNYLFESFIKVVDAFKPSLFIFENVSGMLSAKPGGKPVVNRIFDAFTNAGYRILSPENFPKAVFNAVNYDVPQHRNRVILFGVRADLPVSLESFYSTLANLQSTKEHLTVRDAIGNLPPIFPLPNISKQGGKFCSHKATDLSDPLHLPRHCSPRDLEVIQYWLKNNMNHCSHQQAIDFYKKITGHDTLYVKYRNLEWDKPSPTVVAHLQKDGFMFIHPDILQSRFITIREAACLMSFPRDYDFLGTRASCYKMIGNAVPVNFAYAIAKSIYYVLSKNNFGMENLPLPTKNDKNIKPALQMKNIQLNITRQKFNKINVLIACEESQAVCKEFRELGFNAYSCDILDCSGGHPEWHLKGDVLEVIEKKKGILQTGEEFILNGNWDLMVAHPPCTFLSVSGARWYYHPDDKNLPIEQRRPHPNFPNRAKERQDGINFFLALANCSIPKIAIENPVGIMSKLFRKPNQIVQPYWFGDEATKTTCLWLKNLPLLTPTKIVGKGSRVVLSSGKSLPKWYSDSFNTKISTEMRRTLRSKTFPGFAHAIATQWGELFK